MAVMFVGPAGAGPNGADSGAAGAGNGATGAGNGAVGNEAGACPIAILMATAKKYKISDGNHWDDERNWELLMNCVGPCTVQLDWEDLATLLDVSSNLGPK
ncbi:hypothetical protein MRB53_029465 [Persea americana]|uniref:Uncharacterized protein n=1 Tax=Persea americana TaxID=3435 RepID=A0ACC2KII2_PERAE|nr:hypothetical protein MRB53_029465 [Persea americana]